MTDQPNPPKLCPEPVEGLRTFTLNSRLFYEAVTEPNPEIWGPRVPGHKNPERLPVIPGVEWA